MANCFQIFAHLYHKYYDIMISDCSLSFSELNESFVIGLGTDSD